MSGRLVGRIPLPLRRVLSVLILLARLSDGCRLLLDGDYLDSLGSLILLPPQAEGGLILLLKGLLDNLVPLVLEELLELGGLDLKLVELRARLISRLLRLVRLGHDGNKLLALTLDVTLQLPVDHVKDYTLLSELVDALSHGLVFGDGLIELLQLGAETILQGLDLLGHAGGVGVVFGLHRLVLAVRLDVHLDLVYADAKSLQHLLLLLYLLCVAITKL